MTEPNRINPIIPSQPNKKTRLDQGFPTGILLLILVGIVLLSQGLSAWKIMNLEYEKATLEADKRAFKDLNAELPKLESQKQALQKEVAQFQGQVSSLSGQQQLLQEQLQSTKGEDAVLRVKIEAGQAKLNAANQNCDEKTAELNAAIERNGKLAAEKALLEPLVIQYRNEKNTLSVDLEKLRTEEIEKMKKVEGLKAREEELGKLQSKFSDFGNVIDALKRKTEEIDGSNQEIKKKINEALGSLGEAQRGIGDSLANWKQQMSDVQNVEANFKSNLSVAGTNFQSEVDLFKAGAQSAIKRFDAEVASLQAKQAELDQLQQKLSGINSTIPNDIKSVRDELVATKQQLQNMIKGQEGLVLRIDELCAASASIGHGGVKSSLQF